MPFASSSLDDPQNMKDEGSNWALASRINEEQEVERSQRNTEKGWRTEKDEKGRWKEENVKRRERVGHILTLSVSNYSFVFIVMISEIGNEFTL